MKIEAPQFTRFLSVGIFNTLADVVLFMIFMPFLGIMKSNFVATAIMMFSGYMLHNRVTFRAGKQDWWPRLLRFLSVTGVVLFLVQPALIKLFVTYNNFVLLGGEVLWGKIIAVGFCTLINYVLYKWLVWLQPKTVEVG